MSLMTKRNCRHWQKSSNKSTSKIIKQHIVVILMRIILIVNNIIVPHPKKNSKPFANY